MNGNADAVDDAMRVDRSFFTLWAERISSGPPLNVVMGWGFRFTVCEVDKSKHGYAHDLRTCWPWFWKKRTPDAGHAKLLTMVMPAMFLAWNYESYLLPSESTLFFPRQAFHELFFVLPVNCLFKSLLKGEEGAHCPCIIAFVILPQSEWKLCQLYQNLDVFT
jgi:hypothetical protein